MDRAAHRSYASHRSSLFALFSVSDGLLDLTAARLPMSPANPTDSPAGPRSSSPTQTTGFAGQRSSCSPAPAGAELGQRSICLQRPRAHRVELELASTGRRLVGQKVGRGLAMEGGKASWDLGGMVGDGWRKFKKADILTGRRMLREELNQ